MGALTKCALGEEGPVELPAATRMVNSAPLFVPERAAMGGATAVGMALRTDPSDPSMGLAPFAMPVATGGDAKATGRPEFEWYPLRGKVFVIESALRWFAEWGTGATIAAVYDTVFYRNEDPSRHFEAAFEWSSEGPVDPGPDIEGDAKVVVKWSLVWGDSIAIITVEGVAPPVMKMPFFFE